MEADPTASGLGDMEGRIAALKHRHRNRLQSIASLTSLLGRRLPEGECRNAFADLRARFEALGFVSPDETLPVGSMVRLNLPELADRMSALLDPEQRCVVSVSGVVLTTPEKTAEAAAQILAEMMIELYRRGLPAVGAAKGEVVVGTIADNLLIRVAAFGAQAASEAASDLGWSIAESHARNCGGTLSRAGDGPFRVEACIPFAGTAR